MSLDGGKTVRRSCGLNFASRDPSTLPRQHLLDATAVTGNLMRLNMAFCMTIGDKSLASRRYSMTTILAGEIEDRVAIGTRKKRSGVLSGTRVAAGGPGEGKN
jgi:hypothetical protein